MEHLLATQSIAARARRRELLKLHGLCMPSANPFGEIQFRCAPTRSCFDLRAGSADVFAKNEMS